MNTVKILHCADVHIGAEESFLGVKSELRRRETLLTFEKIVDLALENDVKVLLIAGDLFNSNSIENSFFEGVISKIKSANKLKVVYCAGNHDPLNSRSPFTKSNLPQNLYILGTQETVLSFEDLNLRVYGRSFQSAFLEGKSAPTLIPPNDDTINISLMHGELFGDINSRYNPISRDYINASKMDYIALGHIHKKSDIEKAGDTYFAYSGCPEGQGFDELGEKGVFIGEIGKGICNLKFTPTSRRLHITEKIDVTDKELFADYILSFLSRKYGENFGENLYLIELTGEIAEDARIDLADISARLYDRVYFAKVKNRTKHNIDLKALAKEKTLKGIFVKNMLKKIETAEDKERYERALSLGLNAFLGEVKFDEN